MPLSADDHVAITNVLGRYCIAFDHNDGDTLAADVFAEDAVMINPEGRWEGSEEIRALGNKGDRSHQRHISVPMVIEGDGDGAIATSYIISVDHYGRQFGISAFGTFQDRLLRVDGKWRITFRDILRPHHDE